MDKYGEKSKHERIKKQNSRLEKKSPYNFCDRWCERCLPEVRERCEVYQEEFDRDLKLILNGQDPRDIDILIEGQQGSLDETLELIQNLVDDDCDLFNEEDNPVSSEQSRKQFLENSFYQLVVKYSRSAHDFLKDAFYNKNEVESVLVEDYETISWYHTLLPSKVHRLLCYSNFNNNKYDSSHSDALAQIEIIKKAIDCSEKALQGVLRVKVLYSSVIFDLLYLLSQIANQAKSTENSLISDIE